MKHHKNWTDNRKDLTATAVDHKSVMNNTLLLGMECEA